MIDETQMAHLTIREQQLLEVITNRYGFVELKQKEMVGVIANLVKRMAIVETELLILKNKTAKGDGDDTIY